MSKSVSLAALLLAASSFAACAETRWSGLYVGAHGGYAGTTVDYDNTGTPEQDLNGGILGGSVGYRHQFGGLVLGAEADLSFANLGATVRDGNEITEAGKISSFGTVRATLGWAFGPFLPYVTGGYAWDRLRQQEQCPDPATAPFGFCRPANGFAPFNLSQTKTVDGWVYGGGFEYAMTHHWSIKAEGLVMQFDDAAFVLGPAANGQNLPPSITNHDLKVFKLGVNYRF